ncbi:MAG: FkbM family methyltransferase [Thermostichus sp. BF3_bins_97]
MIKTQLSPELSVWAWSAGEARLLYREVWVEDPYLREGLVLQDEAVVLDVGANIGLWSLALMERYKNLTIHAFEPAPPLYEICTRNLRSHAQEPGSIQTHPLALGAKTEKLTLKFNPLATYGTTFDASSVTTARQKATLQRWATAMAEDAVQLNLLGEHASRWIENAMKAQWTRLWVLAGLLLLAKGTEILGKWLTQRFEVEVHPLGEWIRTRGLERVDMVKIDVEGAEEAVLDGIDDETLTKINQMAIEVHEVPGRVRRMYDRLKRAGFDVVKQSSSLKIHTLLGISTLYARRS